MPGPISSAHQGNDLCGLVCQAVRQLFVVFDQVAKIDITVVLLEERVLAQLVSSAGISYLSCETFSVSKSSLPINEGIVQSKV